MSIRHGDHGGIGFRTEAMTDDEIVLLMYYLGTARWRPVPDARAVGFVRPGATSPASGRSGYPLDSDTGRAVTTEHLYGQLPRIRPDMGVIDGLATLRLCTDRTSSSVGWGNGRGVLQREVEGAAP